MLELLAGTSLSHQLAVHGYVLMSDHFHLLATPADRHGLSRAMQTVGRAYVRYFNDRYERAGALWDGRFKATVIESERYLFTCMAYIELNPVRAGIVSRPEEYAWSSFGHHAGRQPDTLVKEHSLFWTLGNTPFAREAAYKAIIDNEVSTADQRSIVDATLKGWALGSEDFLNAIAPTLSRRGLPMQRGRPRKSA